MDIEQDLNSHTNNENPDTLSNYTDAMTEPVQSTIPEDFDSLPALEKITHVSPKVRAHFYTKILEEIEREGEIGDPELTGYIRSNGDMLMAETIVENQKLILRLCFKIEQVPLTECFVDLSKKSFWYNFLDKFLSSS